MKLDLKFGLIITSLLLSETAFAESYPPWKIGLSYELVSTSLELSPTDHDSQKINFRPSESGYAGVILGYHWVAGTIAFAVPANREKRDIEGESDYHDYKLSYFSPQWGGELSYNSFKSYLIDNSSDLSAATLAGARYYKLPDMKSVGYGANIYYAFSPERYSMPAAIDQTEPQSRSGGSWVGIFSVRRQSFKNTGAFIPTEKQSNFGGDALLNSIHMTKIGFTPAYALLWDGPREIFASTLLGIGLGFQDMSYGTSTESHGKFSIQPDVHAKVNLGVNSLRGFLKVSINADYFAASTGAVKVGNSIFGALISGGLRF